MPGAVIVPAVRSDERGRDERHPDRNNVKTRTTCPLRRVSSRTMCLRTVESSPTYQSAEPCVTASRISAHARAPRVVHRGERDDHLRSERSASSRSSAPGSVVNKDVPAYAWSRVFRPAGDGCQCGEPFPSTGRGDPQARTAPRVGFIRAPRRRGSTNAGSAMTRRPRAAIAAIPLHAIGAQLCRAPGGARRLRAGSARNHFDALAAYIWAPAGRGGGDCDEPAPRLPAKRRVSRGSGRTRNAREGAVRHRHHRNAVGLHPQQGVLPRRREACRH